jgi:hypothetical protein
VAISASQRVSFCSALLPATCMPPKKCDAPSYPAGSPKILTVPSLSRFRRRRPLAQPQYPHPQ